MKENNRCAVILSYGAQKRKDKATKCQQVYACGTGIKKEGLCILISMQSPSFDASYFPKNHSGTNRSRTAGTMNIYTLCRSFLSSASEK
ncbi:hypothetical protein [Anaerotruncus colihominis]|uniref:hypothetical protein n=1 Tax=Anaerotruncus colihominis TaxID=169435 RepID=UPI001123C51C|nr:hypothetical protein [Anaerotruncus colihominis]